jgi:hypothetical protein
VRRIRRRRAATPAPRSGSSLPVALVIIAVSSGCGVRLYTPPAGDGVPEPAGAAALAGATSHCAGIDRLVVSMGMKGRVGDQGLPRGVRYDAAFARDGRIFLEASALGTQRLVFAGTAPQAALWLREGNRVVSATVEAIIEALTGMTLSAADLIDVLSACVTTDRDVVRAERFGDVIRATTAAAVFVLQPVDAGAWRVRWARRGDLQVDYHEATGGVPTSLTLYRVDAGSPAQITMSVRSRETNPPEDELARAFAYTPPASAVPMPLDELRAAVWRRVP